jgi:4-hydroxy-2-oxoheptanedioate aldolase
MPSRTHELRFQEALRQGRPLYGTLVTSTAPKSIEALEGLGLDCVMIDTEHIPMNWPDLGWMCRAYRGLGIVPIVRIPRADPFDACRVLDMGAGGVVAAYIESADEVALLRGASKLRPLKGRKLEKLLATHGQPEGELGDYVRARNAGNLLLVNIESVAALEALDEILAVPDLDGVLLGPHDLSCSLGVPEQYDHPLFEKAVQELVTKARARNIGAGSHNLPRLDQEIRWKKAGMNLILHRSDVGLVRSGLSENLRALREATGEGVGGEAAETMTI